MSDTNHQIASRYLDALMARDLDAMQALRHADFTLTWPQSGERVRGSDNARAIDGAYPGGLPTASEAELHGTEDRWVAGPGFALQHLAGSGELWIAEATVTYAGGEVYRLVTLIELRDGLVWREVEYFAAPFEAPEWRAPWVERIAD